MWAHEGSDPAVFFTPHFVRELLGRHANLSLSIRPLAPFAGSMVNPKAGVNREWIARRIAYENAERLYKLGR